MPYSRAILAFALATATVLSHSMSTTADGPQEYTDWSVAINLETMPDTHSDLNTMWLDGCPAVSRNGRSLYMASNRSGSRGLDLWVLTLNVQGAWDKPANLGEPINTEADEFCPAPLRDGHGLLFVSTRPGGCGKSDIYLTRLTQQGWSTPELLAASGDPCKINSIEDEASPYIVEYDDGTVELYFSSTRGGNSNIYVSVLQPDGSFGVPLAVSELNTPSNEFRPHVRRDGLEILFDSNRPGSENLDIWTATRPSVVATWSDPVRLSSNVNTSASETRAYLSWDATTLYFGSTRADLGEGSTDIYIATREKVTGRR